VDDLTNLGPYNPVVHEISMDFKLVHSKDRTKFSGHHHKLHKSLQHRKHQSLNIVITNQVQRKVAEAFSSTHTHSHRVRNNVPAQDHLQQKHQMRRRE
jgi:hypothetical protein